jgi:hypothetical protein
MPENGMFVFMPRAKSDGRELDFGAESPNDNEVVHLQLKKTSKQEDGIH